MTEIAVVSGISIFVFLLFVFLKICRVLLKNDERINRQNSSPQVFYIIDVEKSSLNTELPPSYSECMFNSEEVCNHMD